MFGSYTYRELLIDKSLILASEFHTFNAESISFQTNSYILQLLRLAKSLQEETISECSSVNNSA